MTTPLPPFEDPSLKSAIRDVAGGHRASAALREKAARAMAAQVVGAPAGESARRLVGVKRWLAMAATIVVAVGAAVAVEQWYSTSSWSRGGAGRVQAPTIWMVMASLHEGHCGEAQSAVASPLSDVKAIAAEASTKFNRRVPAPAFAGWTLQAATYCSVGGHPGIQFRFQDNGRAITVVSLPQVAYGYQQTTEYHTEAEGHQIAGFMKDGGLHCVIGDRGMPLADVQALVDQLRVE